jgi:transcriptional regulator with XRE-family HTH domain
MVPYTALRIAYVGSCRHTEYVRACVLVPTFGEYLRAQYERRGMTRADFARAVGVKYHTVYRWERGEFLPRKHVKAIAAALKVTNVEVARSMYANPAEALAPERLKRRHAITATEQQGAAASLRRRAEALRRRFQQGIVDLDEVDELANEVVRLPVVRTASQFLERMDDLARASAAEAVTPGDESSSDARQAHDIAVDAAGAFLIWLETFGDDSPP